MATEQYPKIYLYKRIVQAKLFIDGHWSEKIDLDNISDEAYFSKFHFIRLFKKIYGKTPHQYLIFVRIEQAMRLLSSGLPVVAVCHAVGFEELSSFSRSFKRMIGINPSVYFQKQQDIKKQIMDSPLALIPHCFAYQYGWLEK